MTSPVSSPSVLDWVSPDEERDSPGKLDEFGRPLGSFHELRTREANNKPGSWTVNHAIHVAKWEAYQAGDTSAFVEPLRMFNSLSLFQVVETLRAIHRSNYSINLGHHAGFIEASTRAVADLEKATCRAISSLQNGGFTTYDGIKQHWTKDFPSQEKFLAARFSSPTGTLPKGLAQNLEKLGRSNYLHFEVS